MSFSYFSLVAGNDSLLVRNIADNVLESYRIEYVDRATKEVYTSLESIKEGPEVRIGCKFMDWHYSTGILNSAMIHLSEFTADDRYAEYARKQVDYCLESYPFFTQGPAEDHRPFHFLRKFRELDHIGTECAALIRLVEKYPHLKHLNREDDLGIEGLRKSKLAYNPVTLIEKHWACLKEDGCEY